MTLQPECLYSLTTTDGQSKGLTSPPLSMGFPMPYSDDFDGYDAGRMPRYFSDQGGIFEIAAPGDRPGKVLRQHIAKKGIEWALHPTPEPFTVLGDAAWTNYNISVDVRIEQRGYAAIYGRIGKCPQSAAPPEGYCFKVHDDGTWQLCNGAMEIASGKIPFHADKWHTVAMQFAGTTISLRADGREVNTVQDATRATGYAGLGTGWNCAEFDNFAIGPAAPGASGTLRNSQSSSLPGSS